MSNKLARIYFTEKDIEDAIMSSKKVMTNQLLVDLARDRGVLLSAEDKREDLAKYLSSFIFDYYDLQVLVDHLTPSSKKEKTNVSKIKDKLDASKIKNELKKQEGGNKEVVIKTEMLDSNNMTVKISYDEIDLSKTRLRQKVRREAVVEIFQEKGSTVIRKPSNPLIDEIIDEMTKNTYDDLDKKETKINFNDLNSDKKRDFFNKLIQGIPECSLENVNKILLIKPNSDNDTEELTNDITDATFKGKNLLMTSQYNDLKKGGYSISSISWQSKEKKGDKNIIEFEASISSSTQELNLLVKGVYRYYSKDDYYTKTIRPLRANEYDKYTKNLEESAFDVYTDINK